MNPLSFFKQGITKKDYQKILLVCGIIFVVSGFLTLLIVPSIVRVILKYHMNMKPGHYLRNLHKMLPFRARFYLWNITNPEEVQKNGAKPIMKDVGPYIFDLRKEKFNQEDNDKEDTWSFDLWTTYMFRPDLTAPLTGNEELTMLNNVLVAAATKFQLERTPQVNFMEAAVNAIFDDPTSIFLNVTAREILFEGTEIDCDKKVFAAKAVCGFLKQDSRIKTTDVNELYKFAILNGKNDSLIARYTTKRGAKNPRELGIITQLNGEPQLDFFKEDKESCNKINGTDRTLFPVFEKKTDIVWSYVAEACRSLVLRPKDEKWLKGIKTSRREVTFGDELLPLECNKNEFVEIPLGALDLHPCLDVFVIVTSPHFLHMEEHIINSIEGNHPTVDQHGARMYFDLDSGGPIKTHERAQINTLMLPVPEYPLMKNVPHVFMPFYWYDEEFDLDLTSRSLIIFGNYTKFFFAIICYPLMIVSVLYAAALTFIFMTNKIPGTPDPRGDSHKVIEVAVLEINNEQKSADSNDQ